jgi:hypothetical protein
MKILPSDATERKGIPLYRGLFCYFPRALVAVAKLSFKGNQQHHPDKPLHWDMSKSTDELDALLRHIIDEDWDAVAWRALANAERKAIEAEHVIELSSGEKYMAKIEQELDDRENVHALMRELRLQDD